MSAGSKDLTGPTTIIYILRKQDWPEVVVVVVVVFPPETLLKQDTLL